MDAVELCPALQIVLDVGELDRKIPVAWSHVSNRRLGACQIDGDVIDKPVMLPCKLGKPVTGQGSEWAQKIEIELNRRGNVAINSSHSLVSWFL